MKAGEMCLVCVQKIYSVDSAFCAASEYVMKKGGIQARFREKRILNNNQKSAFKFRVNIRNLF